MSPEYPYRTEHDIPEFGRGDRLQRQEYHLLQPEPRIFNYKNAATLFLFGKGYEYGSWITDGGRSIGGLSSGDLIENPAHAIEAIARYAGLTTSEIDIADIDTAYTATSSLKINAILDSRNSWIEYLTEIAKQFGICIWFNNQNKLTAAAYNSSANFSVSGTGTPGNRDIYTDSETISGEAFEQHPILISSGIKIQKTPLSQVINEIYINYDKNFANGKYRRTAFITASDSNNGEGTRDQNGAAPDDRETDASNSQTNYKHIGTLTLDCPHIRDNTTILTLRNHLFDTLVNRRWGAIFRTRFNALHLELCDIINVRHKWLTGILTAATMNAKKWIVVRRDIDLAAREIEIEAIELI